MTDVDDDLVRQESRTAGGPADLDVAIDVGRVEVHLTGETAGTTDDDDSVDVDAVLGSFRVN